MEELLLVLRFRFLGTLHDALAFWQRGLAKSLGPLLLFGAFAVGVFFVARMMSSYLIDQVGVGVVLYYRSLAVIFYLLFLTVNLANVIVSVAALFRGGDVEFLMGLPVRYETIFITKLVDLFLSSSGTLLLFGAAFLAGVLSYFDLAWWSYLMVIVLAYLPMVLIAGLSGVLVFVALMRLAFADGFRQFIPAASLLYFLVGYLFFTTTNPVLLVPAVLGSRDVLDAYLATTQVPFTIYLPSSWLAECMHWLVMGETSHAFSFVLLSLTALLAVLGLVVVAGNTLYRKLWLEALAARPVSMTTRRVLNLPLLGFNRNYDAGAQVSVVMKRDLWLFIREPGQWLHLLLLIFLAGAFLVSLLALEFPAVRPIRQAAAFLMVFSFNGFLVATACLRFVFPAVGVESMAFWSVRTSPVRLSKLYWYKFIPLLLLVLFFGELMTVVSTYLLHNDPVLCAIACAAMACIAVALTALNLGAGAYFATFRERNPVRIASSQGGALTFLAAVFYLLGVMLLLLTPLYRYFNDGVLEPHPVSWFELPFVMVIIISAALAVLATAIGLRSIGKEQ